MPGFFLHGVEYESGWITYVPDNFAEEVHEPAASVVNASGNAVEPTAADVTTALGKATLKSDLSADLVGVFNDANADAYPVSAYSYLVVACNPALGAKDSPPTECSGNNSGTSSYPARSGKELGEFIDFIVCTGQLQAGELGYAYLAKNLVKDAFAAIGRINGGLEPPPPTRANCPNPAIGR